MPHPDLRRRLWCQWLPALLLPTLAVAAPLDGRYQAEIDGLPTVITLQFREGQVTGTYVENALNLTLRGTLQGRRLHGQIIAPGSGVAVAELDGVLDGQHTLVATVSAQNPRTGGTAVRQVRFVRIADAGGATAASAAASGGIDPRLVGVWKHEKITNSGGAGNLASFNTVRTLQLGAQGDVTQWVESVGGGGNWNYAGGRKKESSGRWQARDGVLLVQADGSTGFKPATRYRFVDNYLVTEGSEGRQIWRR